MSSVIFSDEHKKITERLKKARLESGLDQNEIAKLLKRTQSYISKIETGQRKVDIVTLKEFAKHYKKNINYFLENNE